MRLQWLLLVSLGAIVAVRPGFAVPKFAREYAVGCQRCHSIPPRLNAFGQAFQANNFNWPGDKPPARNRGLKAFPVSGSAEFSFEDNRTEKESSTRFRELELFLSDGFRAGGRRTGGYFASAVAATPEKGGAGDLSQAFVAVPVAGRRGQWTLTLGQFSAMMYQWDETNKLTDSSPAALADELDEFSFAEPQPGLRVDFFDHRGQRTADGNYLALGVPFEGHLALNSDSRLNGPRGFFAHGFRRRGPSSLGLFAFTHAGSHLEGLIGTHQLGKNLHLLGIGAIGHEDEGSTRRLSLEGEYVANPRLALTARLEAIGGARDDVGGVAALTYYPLKLPILRLTLEANQRKGDRFLALIARGQF